MPTPVHVPRINNNDDEVKLVELHVTLGQQVSSGQVLAAVETDKAVVDVESTADGFVIAIRAEANTMALVGSVLVWLGASADETPPAEASAPTAGAAASGNEPTLKARTLLQRYGLQAAQVSASGDRLTAEDVLRHATERGLPASGPAGTGDADTDQRSGNTIGKATGTAPSRAPARPSTDTPPTEPGRRHELRPEERGMLATVRWHHEVAVPGYIELSFDAAPWDALAKAFGAQHGLLLNPLLSLMAWRLVALAHLTPKLNATLAGDQRHEYEQVNLGFTVQAGDVLYLAVVRNAHAAGELGFVQQLAGLQRRAAGHQLTATETQGTTIGFSSMARWDINRHIPILAPHTALMVAHAVAPDGRGVLGATYDHRVLHGAAVAALLRKLSRPRADT